MEDEEGYCNRVWRLLCVGALPVGVLPFLLGWMGGGLATRGYAQVRDGGETKQTWQVHQKRVQVQIVKLQKYTR